MENKLLKKVFFYEKGIPAWNFIGVDEKIILEGLIK